MCPTICIKNEKAFFSIGASGANHIVPCTMQIAGFLLDYDFTIEEAFNLPRIDVNETNNITVDSKIDPTTIKELKKYFKVQIAQNIVFPKLYSCPSGVMRNSDGLNFGISDVSSPTASAIVENSFTINSLKTDKDFVRA